MGSPLVGRPRKRWIDSVIECFKKRGLNVGQARRMVYDMDIVRVEPFIKESAFDSLSSEMFMVGANLNMRSNPH